MKTILFTLIVLHVFLAPQEALARLEFDSEANKVLLFGPYVKYNVLKEPYSLGRFQFGLDDIRLEVESANFDSSDPEFADEAAEVENPENDELGEAPEDDKTEASEPREPQATGTTKIYALWPRFLMNYGEIKIITKKGRVLYKQLFEADQVGEDEKFARYELKDEGEELLSALNESFQICLDQKFENSRVKSCSNHLIFKNGRFENVFQGKNAGAALLNRKKSPKNAQISLVTKAKKVRVELKFKSGFYIYIRDKIRKITLNNVLIDPQEKRLGIVLGDGKVKPTKLTLKDRFFSFIKEKNYYRNQYAANSDWPADLEDAEMEFAPYQTAASVQLYGLILPNVPPPFEFKLNDDIPIATYATKVKLKGTKAESEVLAAKVRNELFIHENDKEFLWEFPVEKEGELNKRYLSLQYKNKDYYFSKRIFRSSQTAVSGSLALSAAPTLDVVLGANFSAEHWFEKLFSDANWSYQRWGMAANAYTTDQSGFLPSKDFNEKISIAPLNFDILYRFSKGVRPVQSSFGVGARYLNFTLYRSISADIQTQFLGIGAFWHTAPQKIIDDVFNIVPWFRYPKWMEISLFYYPMLLGPEKLGFSFSWQARGKLMFSKHWFLDASFNVNSISFQKERLAGVTQGADSFGIATAHGTIGLGYLFN